MKELQSLLQYAEILGVQVEDLSSFVNFITSEKVAQINSSVESQIHFLLSESGDPEAIRFLLKRVVENE